MNFLRRHPWIPLALLSLAGAAGSIAMVWICVKNAPESAPVEPATARP